MNNNDSNEHDRNYLLALEYHSKPNPGKISLTPTKSCLSAKDLSLAYTPGVAAPCLEIAKDPDDVYKYTAKGNLVAVISNGTAVLGLGNIGPLASKPVMEGKGVLFKRFADIDVFDIELNASGIEEMVQTVKALAPTFGGINLEDIKSPECFEIESRLIESLDIPVFHDDQHGTAIIAAAAFTNALEILNKKINEVKVVFSGAGAAAISCARLFVKLGVKKENLILCDSIGPIYDGRVEGMNKYKEEFKVKTSIRSMKEALINADAFVGVSSANILKEEMILGMAKNPIIFAMANPNPEIMPELAIKARPDCIMATGRSDFPNQVNNVLGFPFIFRGALDVRAKKINDEMKLAAVYALANLAKEEVPEEVKLAYGNEQFSFGKNYLIPKPFDKRVLTRVAPAVAKAAVESKVARFPIHDFKQYAFELEERLGTSGHFMRSLRARLGHKSQMNESNKLKVVFPEGYNSRILQSVSILLDEGQIRPVLLGDKDKILQKLKDFNLSHLIPLIEENKEIEVINPETDSRYTSYWEQFYTQRQRKGINRVLAQQIMQRKNYFGSMLVKQGYADLLITGTEQSYPESVRPILQIIESKNKFCLGVIILVFNNRILFLADCTMNVNPNSEQLALIAKEASLLFNDLMMRKPKVAFLSFSNFGSNSHPWATKVQNAVELCSEYKDLMEVDGEIQADLAVNYQLLNQMYAFSHLKGPSDILIFPNLDSANISYKLLTQLANAQPIGPILTPLQSTANVVQRTSTVSEIVHLTTVSALLAKESKNHPNKK